MEEQVPLPTDKRLDIWLNEQPETSFPNYSRDRGEKSYIERYHDFKIELEPIHNSVEIGAMAAGANKWMAQTKDIIKTRDKKESRRLLDQLVQSDPIAHLNSHGRGHVDKVIAKVSEMLHFFERDHLTPYEGFFLLCAIQLHDVGNAFGREEHEKTCGKILEEKGKNIIKDSFERKVIEKLALVHGGAVDGERDTISYLTESKPLHDRKVRKRLLAALLRFGDELADDSSRADRDGLAQGTILEGSRIYHRYSEALHTVKIDRNSQNNRVVLNLAYEFSSNLAILSFNKNGKSKYLLDEIYDRTLKMERERRYCMRFLRPYFSLDAIRVTIVIQSSNNPYQSHKIEYTLEEKGYPSDPRSGRIQDFSSEILSGSEEKKRIENEWGVQRV